MNQKHTFKVLIAYFAVILAVLPFLVTFSAILTDLFERIGAYVWLQQQIVPYEARYVGVLLKIFGIQSFVTPNSVYPLALEYPGKNYLSLDLQWNCLGWQSMLMLGVTLVTGIKGKWTTSSKLSAVSIGIVGTFLINLFRMTIIAAMAYYINNVAAYIVHDYFATFASILWLLFFWWFSYSYVLVEKNSDQVAKSSA